MMLVPWDDMEMNNASMKKKGIKYWQWLWLGLAGLVLLALLLTGLIWLIYHFVHPILPILVPTP